MVVLVEVRCLKGKRFLWNIFHTPFPETNIAPWKWMVGRLLSFLGIPIFRGELLNFGVGIGSKDQTPFAGRDTASSRVAQWCLGAITAGYRDWCGRRSLEYWYLGRERPQATRISTMENIHCVIHEHTRYIPALVKTDGSQNGWFLTEFPFSKDHFFRLQPQLHMRGYAQIDSGTTVNPLFL